MTYTNQAGANATFGNVVIAGTSAATTLASNLTIDSLTIAASDTLVSAGYSVDINGFGWVKGKFDASGGTGGTTNITVSGNWTLDSAGTFVSGSSTITFDGTLAQSVTTTGKTYNNLIVTNKTAAVSFTDDWTATVFQDTTPDSQLLFNPGSTYTVSGALTLTGAFNHRISLDTIGGSLTQFNFNIPVGVTVNYLTVRNSGVIGTHNIYVRKSVNRGNNKTDATPRWIFEDIGNSIWYGTMF